MISLHRKNYIFNSIILILFLSITLPFFATTLNAAPKEDSITITVMTNKPVQDMNPYREAFCTKYPHINVEYITLSDYDTEAMEMIQSGNYADVLFIPGSMNTNDYEKYFSELGDISVMSETYDFTHLFPQKNSLVYGIPSCAYASGFVYNKEVFEKAGITKTPTTIEEFLECLRNVDKYTNATPFYSNYNNDWALSVWETFPYIEMTGNEEYKNNQFVTIENPYSPNSNHYVVYNLLYRIVEEGLCESPTGSLSWHDTTTRLNNGEIACIAIGSWALEQIKNAGSNANDIGFFPFPNEIDKKQFATISTDYCYAINKNSTKKDAALSYVNFIINESNYSFEHDTISIVKTDPIPESYGAVENCLFLSPTHNHSETSGYFETLSSNLNLTNGTEQQRLIAAAAGLSEENFDSVMNDWNTRWEASRTEKMKTTMVTDAFSQNALSVSQYEVSLSALETEYLENIDTIKVGYLENNAPISYTKDGSFAGLSADICKKIEETLQVSMTYTGYRDNQALSQALLDGSIDFIASMENTVAYSDTLRFSTKYAEYTNVIVKNMSVDVEDLSDKKGAFVEQNASNFIPNIFLLTNVNSLDEAFEIINQQKADYTIANYYSAIYYLNAKNYNNLTIVPMANESTLHFAFAPDVDTELISICNKCIYSIPETEIELYLLDNMDPPIEALSLGKFISIYPIQSFAVVSIVFFLLLVGTWFVIYEREKSSKLQMLSMKHYEILADFSNEYIFKYTIKNDLINFDKKTCNHFGFSPSESLHNIRDDHSTLSVFQKHLQMLIENSDQTELAFILPISDKKEWHKVIVSTLYDNKRNKIQVIGKIVNIQKEMDERQSLIQQSQKDSLTGILNRDGFNAVSKELLAGCKEEHSYILGILDLDNFKSINDSLGHLGGDEALKLLADTLTQIYASDGIVARYGGDEFLILLTDLPWQNQATQLLEKTVSTMQQTISYNEKTASLSISLGAVQMPSNIPLEKALAEADKQLYKVKEQGKNNYCLYTCKNIDFS